MLLALSLSLLALAPMPAEDGLWSLGPLVRPPLPEVGSDSDAHPIDRFVLAELEAAGLAPSPVATDHELLRRLCLVMTGLPPDEAARAAFDSTDWDAWVERTLASPHYGERWAQHWLDLVRFAETDGFETNTPRPDAWPYRDWVIESFQSDRPFDEFVLAQVAGDAIGEDAATGFLVAGPYDTVKSPDVVLTSNQRQAELSDMVNATSTAFLGLTVACAQCHDHKFDPIAQTDFFRMQAVFAGVQHGSRPWRDEVGLAHEARRGLLEEERARVQQQLGDLAGDVGPATLGAVVIDDEDPRMRALVEPTGKGMLAGGRERGQAQDPGDLTRLPNLAGASYTWWDAPARTDVLEVAPGLEGEYRLWISWGAGWGTHAPDARVRLESGGQRRHLATVDQRTFAGGVDSSAHGQPRWSGLQLVGRVELGAEARLVLTSGSGAGPVTADVVVFEPVGASDASLPQLRDGVLGTVNQERFEPFVADALRLRIEATVAPGEPCIDELEVFSGEDNVARRASFRTSGDYTGDPKHRPEHINDGQYGNGRSWISNTRGAGWVELAWEAPVTIERVRWGRDREQAYRDRLARDYVIEVRHGDGPWVVVATGEDRLPPFLERGDVAAYRFANVPDPAAVHAQVQRLTALEAELAAIPGPPSVYGGRFVAVPATHRLDRGDPLQPREVVAPGVPVALGQVDLDPAAPEQERRLALGQWLATHPLTARVIVNRLWAQHFGTGLVATPSDFGHMGSAPSHPELLDWLAVELIESGWSLKHVQRLILGSRTWRQSSRNRTAAAAVDADSRLLWRFPPRRLEAEALRDSVLACAGTLDRTPSGPGWSAFEPNTNYVRVYVPRTSFTGDSLRRMVYMTKVRMEPEGTFGIFDVPDGGTPCPVRGTSTTPLQALSLFNSPFVLAQSQALAQRVIDEVGEDPVAQVAGTYLRILGRSPACAEASDARDLVAAHGLASLARALFNSNEFVLFP